MANRGVVKIVVCGDPGVGKTSLISTAAKDTFDVRPAPVLPPTRLPAEFTPDHVPMLVTDTPSRPEDQQVVDMALRQADVVVVCFDATKQATLDSVRASWYPRIQRLNPDVPVIMACCKADKLSEEREVAMLRERVEHAVHDLPHVEVCLNCSSRTLRMVADVFFYALKSVLYPLQPLYDRLEKRLRPLCVRALKRVFMMCDTDGDGALSDVELNGFQLACFGMALDEAELQNVKQIVASKMPAGVTAAGVTLEGFLFLHVLFIERGRLESTWAVLRKFGYNDQLLLSDEVLDTLHFALPHDQVWELSPQGAEFLARQFALYDEDGDGLLSWQQLDAMYSTLPPPVWQGDAWARLMVPGVYGAAHRLEAFMLKWRYEVMTDPRSAYAHLLYLGYGGPDGAGGAALLSKGVRRKPKHKPELAARTCVQCLVFGPKGAGKTSLLKALVGQRPSASSTAVALPAGAVPKAASGGLTSLSLGAGSSGASASGAPGDQELIVLSPGVTGPPGSGLASMASGGYGSTLVVGPPSAAALVQGPDNRERTLILHEMSEDVEQQVLTAAALAAMGPPLIAQPPGSGPHLPDLSQADVAAFVFDSSSPASFRTAVELMVQVSTLAGETLPCVLVAAKDELTMSKELEAEVAAAAAQLQIPSVVRTSAELGELGGLFTTLVGAALINPEAYVPETPGRKARRRMVRHALIGAGVGVVGLAAAYGLYRLYLTDRSSGSTTTSTTSSTSQPQPTTTSSSTSYFSSSTTKPTESFSAVAVPSSGDASTSTASSAGSPWGGLWGGLSALSGTSSPPTTGDVKAASIAEPPAQASISTSCMPALFGGVLSVINHSSSSYLGNTGGQGIGSSSSSDAVGGPCHSLQCGDSTNRNWNASSSSSSGLLHILEQPQARHTAAAAAGRHESVALAAASSPVSQHTTTCTDSTCDQSDHHHQQQTSTCLDAMPGAESSSCERHMYVHEGEQQQQLQEQPCPLGPISAAVSSMADVAADMGAWQHRLLCNTAGLLGIMTARS